MRTTKAIAVGLGWGGSPETERISETEETIDTPIELEYAVTPVS